MFVECPEPNLFRSNHLSGFWSGLWWWGAGFSDLQLCSWFSLFFHGFPVCFFSWWAPCIVRPVADDEGPASRDLQRRVLTPKYPSTHRGDWQGFHLKMHSGEKSNNCNQCDYALVVKTFKKCWLLNALPLPLFCCLYFGKPSRENRAVSMDYV